MTAIARPSGLFGSGGRSPSRPLPPMDSGPFVHVTYLPSNLQSNQRLLAASPARERPMTDASETPRRLRFAVFEADLVLGQLTRLGRRVPLQEQPFRVLAMLLQQPGELVTREMLRRELWPQAIVDFDHGV